MKFNTQMKYLALAMGLGLSLTMAISSCSKKGSSFTPPTTTGLQAAIDSAKWYLANTHEGTQPGEYTKGSQATLQTALTAAEAVLTAAATSGTQAQVTAATQNLNAAIAAYKAGLITPIAGSSLMAYWKFNGNANDSSGNGHNGTLEAGPAGLAAVPGPVPNLTTDRFGNSNSAYHFSGGGNIDVPYSPALEPTAMTISLWERQDTAGRTDHPADCYMIALNRWNGWKFQMQPTRPFFTVHTDTSIYDRDAALDITIGTTVGAGPWHHLVVTYDGAGTETFYVDGTMVKTWTNLAGAIKVFTPTEDISIGTDLPNSAYTASDDGTGRYYIAWGGYWTGDLDDIMIYNVALTANQVTEIYNQQVSQ
ncbi:MAG TPA: LamG-like jellyroll fold domain-containing protein [Puia sp.]|nr:LamG-like jellyroll fold domain-containing protein [Puia sp.]